jgi:WD40 repeat protein
MSTRQNPFPGPRPYERDENDLFFGRDELVARLVDHIFAKPCTLLYGPSGAGKSSLIQAAVIPQLLKEPRLSRIFSLDRWSAEEEPLQNVVDSLHAAFDLGDAPKKANVDSLSEAIHLAFQVSDRSLFLSFDQIEQLLYPGRDAKQALALFDALERAARTQERGLAIILGIREDYLGLLRDRLRGRRMLLDHGFRVGPMIVGEMVSAVCDAAESRGKPWSVERMRALILQMRERSFVEDEGSTGRTKDAEDQDEVQAAFVQIVCRALWESSRDDQDARHIVAKYLEDKLKGIKQDERRLLEDHLIDAAGNRTMLTLQEAKGLIDPQRAAELLQALEQAAIVRGEEYRADRRYELGHDWLAQRLREMRSEREKAEDEERAREEREKLEQEAAAQLENARVERRRAIKIAIAATVAALIMLALFVWAKQQSELARERSIMAGVREHMAKHENHWAAKLLLEIKNPEHTRDWANLAGQVLDGRMRYRALAMAPMENVRIAEWSPDGTRVLVVTDNQIRIERVFGNNGKWEVKPGVNVKDVTSAVWSPGGNHVAIADGDGSLYVWSLEGHTTVRLHEGKGTKDEHAKSEAVWGSDGLLIAWNHQLAEVWDTVKKISIASLRGGDGIIYWAGFIGANPRALVQNHENELSLQSIGEKNEAIALGQTERLQHVTGWRWFDDPPYRVSVSANGQWLLTSAPLPAMRPMIQLWRTDGLVEPMRAVKPLHWNRFSPNGDWILGTEARDVFALWNMDTQTTTRRIQTHAVIVSAAMSPRGSLVATSNTSGEISVFAASGPIVPTEEGKPEKPEFLLHAQPGSLLSFESNERAILSTSGTSIEVWRVDGTGEPVVLNDLKRRPGNFVWDADGGLTVEPVMDKSTEKAQRPQGTTRSPDGKWIVIMPVIERPLRFRHVDDNGEPRVFHTPRKDMPRKLEFSPDGERLAAQFYDGTIHIWTVSIPALQQRLRDANIDCLPPDLRQLHLDESETEAQARYDECEKSYGRIPFEKMPMLPQPQNSAAN